MNDNRYSDFIRANQELWSKVPAGKGSDGLLLVEPEHLCVLSHVKAVAARVIKEANRLSIGWIDTGDPEIQERLISYDPTSRTIPLSRLTRFDKLIMGLEFVRAALKILLTGDILNLSVDGIRLGDILYDSYLARYQVATIPKVNRGVLSTLLILIRNYYHYKKTLRDSGASAVLVAHYIGLSSGAFTRAALRLGLCVYIRSAGMSSVTVNLLKSLPEIYQDPHRPRPIDMQSLSSIDQETLNKELQEIVEDRTKCLFADDFSLAYDIKKKVYSSRSAFADEFKIPATKKNIFVMLHAFNDHPHSHYGQMLFQDYYDWFVQTLAFAKTKSDVNWIFKEHPGAPFYPTRDISLPDHFANCPDHIVFLDANVPFNTKSLLSIADAIITVLGTAGIEFAAAGGIPSILAGATSYSGFGFTIEPKTQAEYFQALANVQDIDRLTKEQQDIARKVFLYIQRYSYVPFSWSPVLSYEETRDPDADSYYWTRILDIYAKNSDKLLAEFEEHVKQVRRADFSRLARL